MTESTIINNVRRTPWEVCGVDVEGKVTAEAAIRYAELDKEVELRPMFLQSEHGADGIPFIAGQVPNNQAVVQIETNKVLGVVGNKYHCIQNRECFNFMDDLVGSDEAKYVRAGSFNDESNIFIVAQLPEKLSVGDDIIDEYLMLTSSHDGSSSIQVSFCPVRLVCTNGMTAIEGKSKVSIRHSGNYREKLAQAREVLGIARTYYKNLEIQFNKMLDTKINEDETQKVIEKLFPGTVQEDGTIKVSSKTQKIRDKVTDLSINGRGNSNISGTNWALYNGVTEYVDHFRSTRVRGGRNEDEVRLTSQLFMSGAKIKQNAYNLLKVS